MKMSHKDGEAVLNSLFMLDCVVNLLGFCCIISQNELACMNAFKHTGYMCMHSFSKLKYNVCINECVRITDMLH